MMNHVEASTQIHFTTEYAKFRMINGNRQLNERKINKIINEVNTGNDMLRYYPIQVKENGDRLDILDGQHRFWICKKLQRPVFYILVKEDKSMPDIAKINSNVEKWKNEDFINCYVQHGNENYKIIREFLDQYKISLTIALQMLSLGHPGNDTGSNAKLNDDFRNGTIEIKFYDMAIEIAKDALRFSTFAHCLSRSFIIAIYRIKQANMISLDEIESAYNKRPEMLTQQANYKAYVNTLEQIVNVGKQKRIIIL